jgi:hypothetical protein
MQGNTVISRASVSSGLELRARSPDSLPSKPLLSTNLHAWEIHQPVNVGEERLAALVLWNSGSGMLSGEVRGFPQDDFSCVENCTYTNLAPNTPWFVLVRFAPEKSGGHVASLELSNTEGASVIVPFSAASNSAPIPMLDQRVLDAGNVPLGATRYFVLKLSNIGLGTLSGSVRLPSTRFVCVENCSFNIPEKEALPLVFAFTPNATGVVEVEAKIGSLSFMLQGRGISD